MIKLYLIIFKALLFSLVKTMLNPHKNGGKLIDCTHLTVSLSNSILIEVVYAFLWYQTLNCSNNSSKNLRDAI